MNNKTICGRKLNEIPHLVIDGEVYYYYCDNNKTILGKINEEYMAFIYREGNKKSYVFDLNKENTISRFFKLDDKEVEKIVEETKNEVIEKLNIDIEIIKKNKIGGFLKW